eukprot:TRINITY_DN1893_c0_g2_i2.p1 TRINITY_DN1893_c0_g2~~TRINITY_DN1893_c0_g2_i2.p1  ORF type:complete len:308 (-),score=66.32 TRINITY_DN1893_c0_g2_i2:79-1002(-)
MRLFLLTNASSMMVYILFYHSLVNCLTLLLIKFETLLEQKMQVSKERANQAMALISDRYITGKQGQDSPGDKIRRYKSMGIYKATPAERMEKTKEAKQRLSRKFEEDKLEEAKKEEHSKIQAEEAKKKLQEHYEQLHERRNSLKKGNKESPPNSSSHRRHSTAEEVDSPNDPLRRSFYDAMKEQRDNMGKHARTHSEQTLRKAEKSKKELEDKYGSLRVTPVSTGKRSYFEVMQQQREGKLHKNSADSPPGSTQKEGASDSVKKNSSSKKRAVNTKGTSENNFEVLKSHARRKELETTDKKKETTVQ